MAFTIPLTFEWLKHRFLAVPRIILRQSPSFFTEKNAALLAIKNNSGAYILCPICGFSMAQTLLVNNWSVTACSAIGFRKILNNPATEQWLKEASEQNPETKRADKYLSIKQ